MTSRLEVCSMTFSIVSLWQPRKSASSRFDHFLADWIFRIISLTAAR
jgi:hypothetical protein